MLDLAEARALVADFIRENSRYQEDTIEIVDAHTLVKDYGWVFFYDTSKYLKTGYPSHALYGNAPIIVDKEDGSLHITGTAQPTEYYIKRFEAQRRNPLRRLKKWLQRRRSPG